MRQVFTGLFFCLFLMGCGQPKEVEIFDPTTSPYFTSQDKVIEIDGLNLRYRDEGPKAAPVLLMVHGFTSSLESWDGLTAEVSDDFRVIRFDLPGHGLTGPDFRDRYSNEETVEFLSKFITALDIKQPVIIGNSLGGLISWRYAHANPDKVKALVLLSPGGFSINGVTEDPVPVPLMVKLYLTSAPEAGVKQALQSLFADPTKLPAERITLFRDMMKVPGNGDAFVARAAAFTLPDPASDLAAVATPTLILWGDQDVMVATDHGQKFVSAMPNATLKIYQDVGHMPQEETPDKVAEDIRAFLKRSAP